MAQFINCKATWVDASSGVTDETGQELQIWTDSPSFRPDIPIDYSVAPHPWMRLLPIAAGVSEADFRLETPVTFVTFRVRQYNATGNGNWSNPSGTTFAVVQQSGANVPQAPGSPGFVVTEGGEIAPPPPPPPVDPPPPPPPTGGGGASSNYVWTSQYGSTQGLNQWSYLDANGTNLTYNSGSALWTGAQSYQTIWNGGIHPGTSVGTTLRWTAPSGGTALVSGSANLMSSAGSNGVTFTIKHNSTTIAGPTSMTTTAPVSISETEVMLAGEYIDFIVAGISGNNYCSTALTPTIQFTTDGSTPAPPALSSLTPTTLTVNVGGIDSLTAALSSTTPTAAAVTLSSSDTGKATVPATVTIPAGQTSALFSVTGVASGTSTITATYGSVQKTSAITVVTPGSGSWTNAPAGGTVLLDHSFNTVTTAGLTTPYNNTFIVSDGSAPMSPSNVARTRLEAFASEGGDELTYQFPSSYREAYFGLYWRTNSQFQGLISSNKLFFLRGVPGTNGILYMRGGPVNNQSNFSLVWSHNSGGLNNGHIMGGDEFGSAAFPNTGNSAEVVPGIWYKIEQHIRASTTATSRDGFLRIWLNGALILSYDQLNYASSTATVGNPGFINQWVWNQAWDGSGSMGTANTVPWEHYVDHVYIVGKN